MSKNTLAPFRSRWITPRIMEVLYALHYRSEQPDVQNRVNKPVMLQHADPRTRHRLYAHRPLVPLSYALDCAGSGTLAVSSGTAASAQTMLSPPRNFARNPARRSGSASTVGSPRVPCCSSSPHLEAAAPADYSAAIPAADAAGRYSCERPLDRNWLRRLMMLAGPISSWPRLQ
ncbi:hypothetical protein DL89DRAFT_63888 [Linderina pennispora]|uniref:Uncharacterized protein n=1 Tax=Linderina pennispora TaxID=61395 RepID=A0A1Y1VYW0_9FUNG|nr:uncharacterized protein DL89DRAFT_63888 [Linderina pennispora]ORX66450.1 hypothetical protein DL89DRAFT_63888 [Linderina pennispora]